MAAITTPTPSARSVDFHALPLRLRQLVAALLFVAIAGSLAAAVALATRHDAGPSGVASVAVPAAGTVRVGGAAARTVAATGDDVHVVQPGETLWSIARAVRPEGDVRPLVAALRAQTGDRPLEPGQRLLLP